MSAAPESQALVQRARAGDREAFDQIIQQHQQVVYGYLRARLVDATDAEDLTQEVFLRFYLGKGRFDESGQVRPWLIGIARNLLYEHIRRMKRRREVGWTELCLELDEVCHAEEPAHEEAVAELNGCLETLGTSAREALEMRYRSNMRLAQIGTRLRRSTGAVKLLMFRARQTLRHCLDRKALARRDD